MGVAMTPTYNQRVTLEIEKGWASMIWLLFRCGACHAISVTVIRRTGGTSGKRMVMKYVNCPTCKKGMLQAQPFMPLEKWPEVARRWPDLVWERPSPGERWLMEQKNKTLAAFVRDGGMITRAFDEKNDTDWLDWPEMWAQPGYMWGVEQKLDGTWIRVKAPNGEYVWSTQRIALGAMVSHWREEVRAFQIGAAASTLRVVRLAEDEAKVPPERVGIAREAAPTPSREGYYDPGEPDERGAQAGTGMEDGGVREREGVPEGPSGSGAG